MVKKTNIGLVEFAKTGEKRHYPYWYGCFTQLADKALYDYKRKQWSDMYPPKKWTEESFISQFGQRVTDCAGLIKGYMFCETPDSLPVYNPKYDLSADSLIKICTDVVPYKKRPEVGGLICWKKGHVGVYILDGKTVEAKGHSYGTVETDNTRWEKVGRLPWIIYVDYTLYVMSLYEDVLDRLAEEKGLNYWVGCLRTGFYTLNDVTLMFFESEEFKNRNLSDAEFVNVLYKVFFGREPDTPGFEYWMGILQVSDRTTVVNCFIWSPEWQEKSKYIIPE